MTVRLFSRLLAMQCVLGLVTACPPPDDKKDAEASIEDFFPEDGEVGEWKEDTSVGKAGVEVANNQQEAWDLVDGDADPFTERGMVAFAIEHYTNGTNKIELRIWEMPDEAKCQEVYDWLALNDSLYNGYTWTDLSDGTGRFCDTGVDWWINSHKGAYHVESRYDVNDAEGKTANEAFMKAVLDKI